MYTYRLLNLTHQFGGYVTTASITTELLELPFGGLESASGFRPIGASKRQNDADGVPRHANRRMNAIVIDQRLNMNRSEMRGGRREGGRRGLGKGVGRSGLGEGVGRRRRGKDGNGKLGR